VEFTFIVNAPQLTAPTITNVKQTADTVMVKFSGGSFTGANEVFQYEVRNDNSVLNPWVPYGTIGGNQAKEITFNDVNSTVRHKLRIRAYRYPASGEAFSHWVEHTHYPVAQYALTRTPLLSTEAFGPPTTIDVQGIGVGVTAVFISWNAVDYRLSNLVTYQLEAYNSQFVSSQLPSGTMYLPSTVQTLVATSITLFLPPTGQTRFRVRAFAHDVDFTLIRQSSWSNYVYYTPPVAGMTATDFGKGDPTQPLAPFVLPPDPTIVP
jgi:hypothetical protein